MLIACNSPQKALLEREFPTISYLNLDGYRLQYGKKRRDTLTKIIFQLPKILTRVKEEHRWLNELLSRQKVNAVISDNRFGLFNKQVPCVFITHQVYIKTGVGKWADRIVTRWNYHRIKKFNACWIPDSQQDGLAGELSHPSQLPATTVRYLGGLSRLIPCTSTATSIDLLVILSGPEPQRSIFEDRLLADLANYDGKAVLVRGLPGHQSFIQGSDNVTVYNHVPAAELNALLCSAELVISRSGYTTVMDVLKLGKKSILVPTPGQAEQEYLGDYLQQQQLAYVANQKTFSLQQTLAAVKTFPFRRYSFSMDQYKIVLQEFVQSLRS